MNPPLRDWMGKRVWIVGASAGIGEACARALHARGARLALSARSADVLAELGAALAGSLVLPLDVADADSVRAGADQLAAVWGGVDLVLFAAGIYTPMRADSFDLGTAERILDVNVGGVYRVLDASLPLLLRQGAGGIAVIASVAGYSGLPRALAYGPSKAALINLCESLYLDLHPRGIGVYLVNPGFVATRLTSANDFHMPALMQPAEAAEALLAGLARGQFHIHFPRRFSNVLRLLRLLPYRLYFALVGRVAR
ncbi:SDR family oxidoreductase [Massilia sp. TS11]|uniref:SDR family NAD(P)-dependent oxidoreductase n=1 Tax=Massilia sp. TS11 TaxID=2908003 RepID=UPI001EDC6393|nr:SDR family NAD(P)-dependent oxidoreductase [Massilia sp. TS11]MCG2585335.1 SDR family NAD(P)-dependent oxidoreductase [Massilia sp. TS11]